MDKDEELRSEWNGPLDYNIKDLVVQVHLHLNKPTRVPYSAWHRLLTSFSHFGGPIC